MLGTDPFQHLVHKPTGFSFGIARNFESSSYSGRLQEKGRWIAFKPGSEREVDDHSRLTWTDVENYFRDWLAYVRRELDAPDFWDAVYSLAEPEFSRDDSDKPFTSNEQSEAHVSRRGVKSNTLVCSDTAQSYMVIFRMIPNPSPYNIWATGVAIRGLALLGALSPKTPQPYPG